LIPLKRKAFSIIIWRNGSLENGIRGGLTLRRLRVSRMGSLQSSSTVAPVATKLLYRIACGDSTTYRRATAEALALISWLKSFADALQEKKGEAA